MARQKKVKPAESAEIPDDAIIITMPRKDGVAVVFDRKGTEARRYSFAAHGARYGEIAKGYAAKISGSVREP